MSAFDQLPMPDTETPIYKATLLEHLLVEEFHEFRPRIVLGVNAPDYREANLKAIQDEIKKGPIW